MTTFSSIYTSLTGLAGFSEALNVISNNVANLNSPGFKASEVLFRDLGPFGAGSDSNSSSGLDDNPGQGTKYDGSLQDFSQGTFQSTGNPTDLAINGNGFFVLKDSKGQIFYTQNGQFTFDANGYLIDSASKSRVQALSNGQLSEDRPQLENLTYGDNQVVVDGHTVDRPEQLHAVKCAGGRTRWLDTECLSCFLPGYLGFRRVIGW